MPDEEPRSTADSGWRTFVRLLGFLRPYRASLIVSSALAILSQLAGVLVPVLTGVVINEIDGDPDTRLLVLEIAAIVALGLVRGALMYGRRIISGRQALGVEYDLRDELYSHFLRLSFGFYDRSQTGQLMSRATIDLQAVRFFLGYGLIFFAQHVVTIVVVTAVLFVYSWKLALVALAITPIIAGVAYRYSRVSQPVLREVQQNLAEVAIVAEESITGVHVVKSFAQESRRAERFGEAANIVFERTLAANRQRALYVPLLTFLPLVAQALVLLAAGRMVISGSLSLGRVLHVQPAARDARHAAADARDVDRPGPACDRRRQADLRDPRRAGGGLRSPGRRSARPRARTRRVRGRLLRLRPGATRARGRDARRPGGPHDRAHRADRLGKDDARGARTAVLRHDRRPRARRRRRRT